MTDDKVRACRQDVLDWIDNGMPAGALNFSETLRDSIKAIANDGILQAERDKLSAEVERLRFENAALDQNLNDHAAELKSDKAKLTALVEITDRITPIPEVLEALAELPDEMNLYLDGAQAGAGWEIGPITVGDLRRLADIAHHSAPVGEAAGE